MEEFVVRALLGGVGVAMTAGPLGCVVVWRRMAYFGEALAHSALLGVLLGFLLNVSPTVGIVIQCVLLAVVVLALERKSMLASDTLLGILAHSALAIGLVTLAFLDNVRVDLMGYLFGDILAVSNTDIGIIFVLAIITLLVLARVWRGLLNATINEDLAAVEGVPVARVKLTIVLLLAGMIAIGMKIVGMLLIISLMIIPAAAARRLSKTPEQMAIGAALVGSVSVLLGVFGSLRLDVPTGPAIVVIAVLLFVLSIALPGAAGGVLSASRSQ